jgi:hypothetical protein
MGKVRRRDPRPTDEILGVRKTLGFLGPDPQTELPALA